MQDAINVGEQFAILTGQIEDTHGIAVEGQRSGLSRHEAHTLVKQVRCQLARIEVTCRRIMRA